MKPIAIALILMLSGCAQFWWTKQGVTNQEAEQDNYACLREAQQRVAGASYNVYGGAAQSQVITNQNLHSACMRARGYSYEQRRQ